MERTNDTRAPRPCRRSFRTLVWVLLIAIGGFAASTALADGIAATFVPDTLYVLPDSTFTLTLSLESAGHAFNGYDAVITYDTSALTFLPTSPLSQQEGSSMVSACADRFHWFQASGDSLSVSHVLLCNGVSLTGPAQLYKLRFRAAHTPQYATVHVRHIQFYDAGLYVLPSTGSDARVCIGVPVDVPREPAPTRPLLRVSPNPCRSAAAILVETPDAGAVRLSVCDVQGRVVRRIEAGSGAAGARRLAWDLKDQRGERVAPGVYRVFLLGAGAPAGARVVVLP